MKPYRKILLYTQVAFVLLFMGKISKAGLYAAYFHTIQDVEIRNSQDLNQSKAKIYKELGAALTPAQSTGSNPAPLAGNAYEWISPTSVVLTDWAVPAGESPSLTLRLLISQPNRAP